MVDIEDQSFANHQPKMRPSGSWWKTLESPTVFVLSRLGRPKIVLQLFLVVCVGYFLVVTTSRHQIASNEIEPVTLSSENNNTLSESQQVNLIRFEYQDS